MPTRRPSLQGQELLAKLKIHTIPVPVTKIAKSLGAIIQVSPLDDELSGLILIKNNTPIIGVNSQHHINRQRFTIAHEIGHLMLHRHFISNHIHVDRIFPALMRDSRSATGIDLIEREANQFAAGLLMPDDKLVEYFGDKQFDIDDDEPIEKIAKKFQVSKQAMMYRMRNLGATSFI
jgi:Zn-dependent peptidase ImmA (M78 family)